MKKILTLTSLFAVASIANAQADARLISVSPIQQQISVPRQVCTPQYVNEPVANSGGAVLGAVVGGLLGNAIGGGGHRGYHRHSNDGAIALGAIGGALVGSQVGSGYTTRQVQNCYTQTSYENNVTGYNVSYELYGRVYNTQTSNYPGTPGQYVNLDSIGYNSTYNPPVYTAPIYNTYPVYSAPVYVTPTPIYYNTPSVIYAPPVYIAPPRHYYRSHRHHRGY